MKIQIQKCFHLLLLTACLVTSFTAHAKSQYPYNHIVFLGDSLTDNGNLYRFDLGALPKSPPYFQGRFSNGITWAEDVAKYYADKHNVNSLNYAVGGETTIPHIGGGYLPYSLSSSVTDYLFQNIMIDKSHTLFIIWIGANDYLPQTSFDEKLIDNVISGLTAQIDNLIFNKAKNFLIVNLPDLAFTPRGNVSEYHDLFLKYTNTHNAKLLSAMTALQDKHKDVSITTFDIDSLFLDMIANPEFYNKKYHTHIADTTTACWNGGYTLQEMSDSIQQDFLRQHQGNEKISQFVNGSPDLREAYLVSKQFQKGESGCNNPDDHLFWDSVHPSSVAHSIIAAAYIDFIGENYIIG